MVSIQTACQFLDSFGISYSHAPLVFRQGPPRLKFARVADLIRPISQIDRQRPPDDCCCENLSVREKERKNTREFSWDDEPRRYYEIAISLRARIFLIPLAKYRASMLRLKPRDKLATESLIAKPSAIRFAAPLAPGGNNNATCLVEGRE